MRSQALAAVLILAHTLAVAAPASAAPVQMTRDRVDGSSYFTWDAETGTFPPDGDYGSAIVVRRGDRVRFVADARLQKGGEVGERLVGLLSLRLKGQRPVRYRGTFVFKVQWDGVVYHRAAQEASFTLRQTPERRRKVLRFPFDLAEDGTYAVTGRFVASP